MVNFFPHRSLFTVHHSPFKNMDLFEFFRENESKLHERPPEQIWKKLESRLERRRARKRRMIRFLQLGTVIAALVLLLLTAGLVWYFVKHS